MIDIYTRGSCLFIWINRGYKYLVNRYLIWWEFTICKELRGIQKVKNIFSRTCISWDNETICFTCTIIPILLLYIVSIQVQIFIMTSYKISIHSPYSVDARLLNQSVIANQDVFCHNLGSDYHTKNLTAWGRDDNY